MSPSGSTQTTALLTGPTATGKSAIAYQCALENPRIEIVNADSLLFYRGADIGTAKPSPTEQSRVRHHLIDVRDPDQRLTAGEFRSLALDCIKEIEDRGQRALVVGGSGFFLKALRHGIWNAPPTNPKVRAELESLSNPELHAELTRVDQESAEKIGPHDRYRLVRAIEIFKLSGKKPSALRAEENLEPDPRFPLFVIDREERSLEQRIEKRTEAMLESGWLEEYKTLESNYGANFVLESVGYAQVGQFLRAEEPPGRKVRSGLPGLRDEIQLSTRQLVKSQRTWFRRQPKTKTFLLDQELPQLLAELQNCYS